MFLTVILYDKLYRVKEKVQSSRGFIITVISLIQSHLSLLIPTQPSVSQNLSDVTVPDSE